MTPDEKSAKGILWGYLTPDEVTTYSQEGRCFRCHTKGHMKRDCPKKDPKSQAPKPADSAAPSTSTVSTVIAHPDPPRRTPPPDALFKFYGMVRGTRVVILLDTGSAYDVISDSLVKTTTLPTQVISPIRVSGFAQGMNSQLTRECPSVPFNVQTTTFHRRFVVSPLVGCDMIFGLPWARDFAPKMDWEALTLTLLLSDGTPITIRADPDIPSGSVVPLIATVLTVPLVTDRPAQSLSTIAQSTFSQALVPKGHSTQSVRSPARGTVRPRFGTPHRSPTRQTRAQDRRLAFHRRHHYFDSRLMHSKFFVPCFTLFQGHPPAPDPRISVLQQIPIRSPKLSTQFHMPSFRDGTSDPPWQLRPERLATHRGVRRFDRSTSL